MHSPLVSLIIPVFNRPLLLKEAIGSAQAQTYNHWEALVVDDRSDDKTMTVASEAAAQDKRIRVFQRSAELEKGPQTCRNIGMKEALGQYIVFLDSDDLLEPACLAGRVQTMQNGADLDFAVFPQMVCHHQPGDSRGIVSIPTDEDPLDRFLKLSGDRDVPWLNTAPIWRVASLRREGLSWLPDFPWDDVVFHFQALVRGLHFISVPSAPDCYYRMHGGPNVGANLGTETGLAGTSRMLNWMYEQMREYDLLTSRRKRLLWKSLFFAVIHEGCRLGHRNMARTCARDWARRDKLPFIRFAFFRQYIALHGVCRKRPLLLFHLERVAQRMVRSGWFDNAEGHYLRHYYNGARRPLEDNVSEHKSVMPS